MAEFQEIDILLVEDNPTDAELTLRALKKRNVANNVFWVKDGVEALDFLFCTGQYANRPAGRHPHLILLDLKLPRMNGIEVLEKIRSDERTKLIPVVMMTSSEEERNLVESYKRGVNSYIVKPVDFEKFTETVAEVGFYWMVMNKEPR